jgi:hypothetical protein
MASRTARNTPSAAAQRGQAMMIGVVIIFLGIAAVIYTTATSGIMALANRQSDDTTRAMAQVKEALIGWSAARTPIVGSENRRPGELPCPDNDNTGTDSGSCVAGAIGRVPWRSLGIPEPKDSSGETLWYAIAGPFRNYGMSTTPITSNTQGNLTVYLDSSSATMTSQAIAVIFAPGAALGTQDRSTTAAACATTGTTIARNLCAENYLDTVAGINNATPFLNLTPPSFIQAGRSGTFNDRVLAITNADLMPLVEQRVAREMISLLNQYRAATATSALYPGGVYPWADLSDGNSNAVPILGAYNRNRFPCGTASPTAWGAVPSGGTTATPVLPNWLKDVAALGDTKCSGLTGWNNVVYYAVSRSILELTGITCTTCTAASLSITNPSSVVGTQCTTASTPVCTPTIITAGTANMLLIMSGGYTGSPARNWPSASFAAITGYFEDGENSDNDDDSYTVPTSTLYNRDRIFIVR